MTDADALSQTLDAALESIRHTQRARIIRGAEAFLSRHPHYVNHFLRFDAIDFSCARSPLALDAHARIAGDARAHLQTLTAGANLARIDASTKKTSFTRRTPDEEIASQAAYGFRSTCAAG